jgi:hypothetical protein
MPPVSLTARAGMTCAYGLGAAARVPPGPPPAAAAAAAAAAAGDPAPPDGAVAAAGAPVRGVGAGEDEGRAGAGAHELAATAAAAREPNQSLLRTMRMAVGEKIADVDAGSGSSAASMSGLRMLKN